MKDFPNRNLTQDEIDFTYKGYVNQMSNKDKRQEFINNFYLNDIDISTHDIQLIATLLTNNTTVKCENGIKIYSCDWVKAKKQYEQAKGNN